MTAPTTQAVQSLPYVIAQIQKALDAGPMEGTWVAAGPSFGEALPKYLNEVVIEDGSDSPDSVCGCEPAGDPESSATMDYIAACNPENIRVLLSAISAHEAEVGRLTAQAAKLREALTCTRAALERANNAEGGPIIDTIWYDVSETLFDYIDSFLNTNQGEPK
jgi:hypothetical protein